MALKITDIQSKMDRAIANGHDAPKEREYVLLDFENFLKAVEPPQFIVEGLFEEHSVVGVVGPPESGKSLLLQEMALCVALGVPFHGRRTKRGLVVYLVGEGQHGLRRRFQALETRYKDQLDGEIVPFRTAEVATSLIDPLEVARVQMAIAKHEASLEMQLTLLIVDTLARFISPGDESKAMDMGSYLAAIDTLRGGAAAVSLHHPGHGESVRARGSSSFKAGLDTEFSVACENQIVTVTCQKMKDGAKPEPFSFKIEPATTRMATEDGAPVMSVLLTPTDPQVAKPPLRGKNQRLLLTKLENEPKEPGVWTEGELRELAKSTGMDRFRAREAVFGLRQLGYLVQTIGGSRLAY
jgi:AAA domain